MHQPRIFNLTCEAGDGREAFHTSIAAMISAQRHAFMSLLMQGAHADVWYLETLQPGQTGAAVVLVTRKSNIANRMIGHRALISGGHHGRKSCHKQAKGPTS
jgi:hypothetical protein